jgi:acyl carrier protein
VTREDIFKLIQGRLVELAMSLEEELSLEIPDEELEGIRTVKDAVDFVAERVPA